MNCFDKKVLDKTAKEKLGLKGDWNNEIAHPTFTVDMFGGDIVFTKKGIKRAVELARLEFEKKIKDMKIDIIGNCAYQGADLPKTWLKNEVPLMQARNKVLAELLCFLQEKERGEKQWF